MLDIATDTRGDSRKYVLSAFLFQVVALGIVGWVNRHALNPDGIAYLRIASYYADGIVAPAISGYWGPLISWLLVPWLKAGVAPLIAARIVMGLSAVFFLSGCLRIFQAFGLSGRLLGWGVWICAIVSVAWSVENITPDLLLAGLVCYAFAPMVTEKWLTFAAFTSGLWWGAAYLGKAIGLPLALLTSIGLTILWWRKRPAAARLILRSLALTLLGISVIAVPWIGAISEKHGALTISTSARLNHVLVGPTVAQPLYVLDQGFRRPEPGRITIWEDPPMPYPDWSPLSNWNNAWLQLRIIARNVPLVLAMLTSLNLAFPLLAIHAIWFYGRRKNLPGQSPPMTWAAGPIAALSVLFLPNYLLITEQRYFYPAFPLFFVVGAGVLFRKGVATPIWIQRYGAILLALSLFLPTFGRIWFRPGSSRMAGDCAYELAQKIRDAKLSGPVAGSARLPGGRAGLYLAYLLDQPWFGDEPAADVSSYRRSGATLIVVRRGSRIARDLEGDPWFRDLDPQLFGSVEEADRFPLRAYKNLAVSALTAPPL
jgi:hypothetical protein